MDFLLPNIQLKYNFKRLYRIAFSTVFNYARPNFVDGSFCGSRF